MDGCMVGQIDRQTFTQMIWTDDELYVRWNLNYRHTGYAYSMIVQLKMNELQFNYYL